MTRPGHKGTHTGSPHHHFEFEFEPGSGVLLCRIEGHIDDRAITEWYKAIGKHVERTKARAGIVDLGGVTAWEVSANTIREIAAMPPALPNKTLPRIIVADCPVVYGMMRMFQMLGEETRPELKIVRTMDDAFAMFKINRSAFQPV